MKWFLFLLSIGTAFIIGYMFGDVRQEPLVIQHERTEALSAHCQTLTTPEFSANILSKDQAPEPSCRCNEPTHCTNPLTEPSSSPSLNRVFDQLLKKANYVDAMGLYHTVWGVSQEDASTLHQLLVEHINQLITGQTADYARAQDAVDTYLADFYDDIEILLLKARTYASQQFFYDAINTFQLANNYAYSSQNQSLIQKDYRQFIQLLKARYNRTQQWSEFIDLYLHAENAELLSEADRFHLIELYLLVGNRAQAEAYADILINQPKWRKPLLTLFDYEQPQSQSPSSANNDRQESYDSVISLTRVNNQYVVPILLSSEEANLLIDTGASMTTISEKFYESIKRSTNMQYKRRATFLTANGRTTGEIYQVDKLTIGNFLLRDIDIAVLDYPTSRYASGLLGMNVLQQFQFKIDQQESALKLSKP